MKSTLYQLVAVSYLSKMTPKFTYVFAIISPDINYRENVQITILSRQENLDNSTAKTNFSTHTNLWISRKIR